MKKYNFDFSIIIPHYNSLSTLPRLLESIPLSDNLEIIIVDNCTHSISKDNIKTNRNFKLLFSDNSRGAGGARNTGLEVANGKWIVFADADDFFPIGAFDVFYKYLNFDYDLIYFKMSSVDNITMLPASRGDVYSNLVENYLTNNISEDFLRYNFDSPCSKLISHDLIKNNNIKFDEVIASNDVYFSLLVGFYAKKITAENISTYVATVVTNSLTKRKDVSAIKSRFQVLLRKNYFLKKHGKSSYQGSIMFYLIYSAKHGIKTFLDFISLIIKYRQNIFVGYRNWIKTAVIIYKLKK